MMDWNFFYGLRILEHLDDWKTSWELARELQLPEDEVREVLEAMVRRGLVLKDGVLYLRWEGRA